MRDVPHRIPARAVTVPDLDNDRASSLHAGSPRCPRQQPPRRHERDGTGHQLIQLPGDQQLNLTPSGQSGHHAQIGGATCDSGGAVFRVAAVRMTPERHPLLELAIRIAIQADVPQERR